MPTLAHVMLLLLSMNNAQMNSSVTFSGGRSFNLGRLSPDGGDQTTLGLSYGYRFRPHVQLDAGVLFMRPVSGEGPSKYGPTQINDSFVWTTFGTSLILPVPAKRLELSLGAGGLIAHYSGGTFYGYSLAPYTSFGGYVTARASVALDHKRHFWIGVSPRIFLSNGTYTRDRWTILTGDLSFHF